MENRRQLARSTDLALRKSSRRKKNSYKGTPVWLYFVNFFIFLDDLISRYSSWQRLLRVFAWILHFKGLILPKEFENIATVTKPKARVLQKLITCLLSEEISKAEMLIISYFQHKYYKEEMDDLSKGKLV